jgi:flagellar motor protein MotB
MRNILIFMTMFVFLSVVDIFPSPMQMRTVVAVTGNAIEALSRNPVSVKISVHDNTGKRINQVRSNAAEGGYYYVTGLFPGNTYTFKVVEEGFFQNEFSISIPNTDKYIEISRDFVVNPLKTGWRIPLSVSPFEMNKTKLRFGASIILDDVVNTLKNNPKVKFTIKAFPDNNLDAQKNIALTKARAESLMDYFIVNGINPSRISIEGSEIIDPDNPPPTEKRAKGKRYIGSAYIVINEF